MFINMIESPRKFNKRNNLKGICQTCVQKPANLLRPSLTVPVSPQTQHSLLPCLVTGNVLTLCAFYVWTPSCDLLMELFISNYRVLLNIIHMLIYMHTVATAGFWVGLLHSTITLRSQTLHLHSPIYLNNT